MLKRLCSFLILFGFALASVTPAYADHCNEAKTIFGDNYTLAEGDSVECNLVVMGGNVSIEEGATIPGNVVVWGGDVEIAGTVEEDVTVMGGNVDLQSTAHIQGRLTTIGGSLSRDEGAQVDGGENRGLAPSRFVPNFSAELRPFEFLFNLLGQLFMIGFLTVGAAAVALFISVLLPDNLARVSAAIGEAPVMAGFLGMLSTVAIPMILGLVTLMTLFCLSPITLVGALMLGAASLLGWFAVGHFIGMRLLTTFAPQQVNPALATALGTVLITFSALFINLFPCIGWLFGFALSSIGLGAVILTRFGTQPYFNTPAPYSAPPSPPPAMVDETPPA